MTYKVLMLLDLMGNNTAIIVAVPKRLLNVLFRWMPIIKRM